MDGVGGSRRGATRHRRRSVSLWVAVAAPLGSSHFPRRIFKRERGRRSGRITGQTRTAGHACWVVVRETDGPGELECVNLCYVLWYHVTLARFIYPVKADEILVHVFCFSFVVVVVLRIEAAWSLQDCLLLSKKN